MMTRTALHLAAGNGHYSVIEFLCSNGANVNAEDRWGGKPLDDAQLNGHTECVEILQQKFGAKHGNSDTSFGREALIDLFDTYGKSRDGQMTLDWHDVSELLHDVGQEPTDAVVRKLFEAVDVDNDGYISKEEFLEKSDLFLQGRPARIILVVWGMYANYSLLTSSLCCIDLSDQFFTITQDQALVKAF